MKHRNTERTTKRIIKDELNAILLRLTGSRSLVNLWWKSPNKAFSDKTPIAMWKGTTEDRAVVTGYLMQMASGSGY